MLKFTLLLFAIILNRIHSQNITNIKLVQTINKTNGGHFMAVDVLTTVKFNESTTYIASGSYDARVKIWEILPNLVVLLKLNIHLILNRVDTKIT